MKSFAARLALATAALFTLGLLLDRFLLATVEVAGTSLGELPPALGWRLLAALLTAVAALSVARWSRRRGGSLFAVLFLAVWGVGALLPWIEAVVFLHLTAGEQATIALLSTLGSLAVAALVTGLAGPAAETGAAEPRCTFAAWGWSWRAFVCAVAYVFLYLAAGLCVYPFVRSYYETSGQLPDAAILPPLQLGRGLLYVLVLLPLVRSLTGSRRRVAFAVACFVPVFAGMAALLTPNPILPDAIRPYHLVEIAVSNGLYGLLIGWLFWAGYDRPGEPRQSD